MKLLKKIIKFIAHPRDNYPNIYIFGYHVLKAFHKIILKFGFTKDSGRLKKDMFNWTLYNLHYKGELKEAKKNYTLTLMSGDYQFRNLQLAKHNENIKPLHPSHRFLYETILQLNPQSVFEMGCGTGVHLHNLQTLLPKARICGIDLSHQQLNGLKKTYPGMADSAKQADATTHWTKLPFEICDLTFTQAVIMHIHTGDAHLVALENLFKMAKKYVILYESMKNHHFLDDIKKLHLEKKIAWKNVFFYYRINKETGLPAGLICSPSYLNYPELTDYNILIPTNNLNQKNNK